MNKDKKIIIIIIFIICIIPTIILFWYKNTHIIENIIETTTISDKQEEIEKHTAYNPTLKIPIYYQHTKYYFYFNKNEKIEVGKSIYESYNIGDKVKVVRTIIHNKETKELEKNEITDFVE